MNQRLTVLQLTASGDRAGATRSIADLSRALRDRGHRVVVGARPESHIYERLADEGFETAPIPFRRKMAPSDAKRVAEIAGEAGAHVVNAHASKDRYAAIFAKMIHGMRAPVVVTRRVMPSSRGGKLQGWFYDRGTDRTVAVSTAVAQELIRLGIPATRITTIPNGLPPGRLGAGNPGRDDALMSRLGLDPAHPVVGVVSRLKDQADLLRALAIIDRPLNALFVGIVEHPHLAALRQSLPERHRVRYVEFVWDVLPFYGLLDVSLLPSRIEGLSQTLLESMGLGIPTIATRAGGNTDLIHDGVNGLLYASGDAQDLAEKLTRLLDDQELRDRITTAARTTAADEFSLDRTVDRTERLYQELANGLVTPAD